MNDEHDSSPKQNLDTKDHVSKSVYFHSPEMMALVKEMHEHWSEDPNTDVIGDRSFFYYSGLLVTYPEAFVELACLEFGLNLQFDSGREAEICFDILNAMRKRRGAPTLARESFVS
jgi:hypothetical protein